MFKQLEVVCSSSHSSLLAGDFTTIFPDVHLPTYAEIGEECELISRPPITVYGRSCIQHRDVGFFCDDDRVDGYHYSAGVVMPSKSMPPIIRKLTDLITKKFGTNHNACLVNRYLNGSDTIGAHRDNESTLGTGGVIALTIYERPDNLFDRRKFRIAAHDTSIITTLAFDGTTFTPTKRGQRIFDHLLSHGEIVVMAGAFQSEYTHAIPAQKRILHGRVSLTWRCHTS